MNAYQAAMMDAPSIISARCAFCGRPETEKHHIVPRSQGGAKGPLVSVCGFGNTSGCHGLLHAHKLHLRYSDGWEYLYTPEPTKYDAALTMDGWDRL